MKLKKNTLLQSLVLAAAVFASPLASALQMEPLSLVLKPAGAGANQIFSVINESDKPIAVQFNMTTREQTGNEEVRKPADDQFVIYPPQTIIPAKTAQKVRVQWLGESNLQEEKAYRLIAEQVHVSLDKDPTGVTMLMKLVGALYVQPTKTASNVSVSAVKPQGDKLSVTVANSGTRHQLLNKATLNLRNGGQVISLKGDQLLGLEGKNVLAKSTQQFFIQKPAQYQNAAWVATLDVPKK
ncbi:molecular chaperone [Leucothrix sargassi]|nr:molecular chaperone [Leucothrix sargassi]